MIKWKFLRKNISDSVSKCKVKNIIFDLGNTLVHFDKEYFFEELSKVENNLKIPRLKRFISENELEIFVSKSRITNKEYFLKLKKKFKLKIGYADFIYIYSDIFWENSQMKKFIEALYGGNKFKLFLMSNTDAAHFNFIKRNFPYVNLIKKKVLSYKVKMLKPGRQIFKYIIEHYNINPGETIFIDDMQDNINAAAFLGFHTIRYKKHKAFISRFKSLTAK